MADSSTLLTLVEMFAATSNVTIGALIA